MTQRPFSLPKSVQGSKSLEKLYVHLATRGSRVTADNYVVSVRRFSTWLGIAPDEALGRNRDWAATINEYITDASRNGLSSKSIQTVVLGVKKWLIISGTATGSILASVELPKIIPTEEDRTPTREELQRILAGANIEDKVPALIAIGAGLRVRAVASLRFKHFVGLELRETGKVISTRRCQVNAHGHYEMVPVKIRERALEQAREIPAVHVKAEFSKTKRPHFTFITPECVQVLKAYVKERQMRGEELTPESHVVVNVRGKGKMDIKTVERRWRSLLIRAGLDEKSETGRVRWYKLHFHTLRSFFSTQCINAGIEENVVKFFRGDRGGTLQEYYMKGEAIPPEYLEIAEEKYHKALPSLTIISDSTAVAQDAMIETFNRQFLKLAGYSEEEVNKLGDLTKIAPEQVQDLIQQRQMQALGLNANRQKVVPMEEVKRWIGEGWEFATVLPSGEAIIKLPRR